jgi:hypothetical protein
MFFPFYATMMLGVESSNVIALRMLKLAFGGHDALDEMQLMMREKVNAAFESGAKVMAGASAATVVDGIGSMSPRMRHDFHDLPDPTFPGYAATRLIFDRAIRPASLRGKPHPESV